MKIIDYKRGNDEGGILINGKDQYIAVTVSTSKKFKSLRGAQKFLESYGYNPVKSQIGSSSAVDQYLENNPSAKLAKITVDTVLRKDTDLTVRGLSSFTFSFEGDSPEAVRKIKRFFGRKAKIEGEYDKDTDTTYIYVDIPSKKNSIGQARKSKRSPRLRGRDDIDWWVAIENNYARRTNSMLDYSGNKEDMLNLVMAQVDDYAYNHNDSDLIKSIDRAKTAEDLFKREGHISKDKEEYSISDIGDKSFEVLHVTAENFEKLSDIYPDIYDRFKDDFDEEDIDY